MGGALVRRGQKERPAVLEVGDLRLDPATRAVAVLMITALDQPSDVDRAVDAGTDDFLTKPINQTDLLRRVRALLASRRSGGSL